MQSIYERALGSDFAKLHPKIQERFGFTSRDKCMSLGVGTMDDMWTGGAWCKPLLSLGTRRRIMFPESQNQTRFVVENYAFRDALGRETVSWVRTFDLPKKRRRFDAYMIYSEKRAGIVDYLGTHQHLAVDLHMRADENGGLRIRSGAQRFYEHLFGWTIPQIFAGTADVCEWFDDELNQYRIRVDVRHAHFGRLFGYDGRFDVIWLPAETHVPREILPARLEKRE